jgi:excisionase family DNA binding protein
MSDKLLRVNEVAEILRVSPMTILRWCNNGHLPCIKIGVSRRIRESDLDYILKSERGPQKLKVPEPEPVYNGPSAEELGFDCEADEIARFQELHRLCEEAKPKIEAIRNRGTVLLFRFWMLVGVSGDGSH